MALERDPAGALHAGLNGHPRDRILKRYDVLRIYLEELENTALKTLELLRGFQTDGGVKSDIREEDQFEYGQEEDGGEKADGVKSGPRRGRQQKSLEKY